MSARCGGCRDLGAHVRWCPEVVGPRAAALGRWADLAETLADTIGAGHPESANAAYRMADRLRMDASAAIHPPVRGSAREYA